MKSALSFDGAVDVDSDPERVIHTREPHGLIHPGILRLTTDHGPQIQQPPIQHVHLPGPLHRARVNTLQRLRDERFTRMDAFDAYTEYRRTAFKELADEIKKLASR